ncbi:MAG: 16S rRNA pseudouridine(516) synthase [Gammaproteobacteria bacterium]
MSRSVLELHVVLFSQGFGTRRVCWGLVQQGLVQLGEDRQPCEDPALAVDAEGLVFWVQGERWEYHAAAYLMLHKPSGFECSHKPGAHPGVYTLLPAPLRQRGGSAAAGVQAVGRLDHDTTGLLLLSDDGKFIHRMTSPRHHVPKIYEAGLKHPLSDSLLRKLTEGVVLDDDPRPVKAASCRQLDSHLLELVLTEGKYHQVKRMVAAAGNRVETLHRRAIGALELPAGLEPGQWRWLTPAEVAALTGRQTGG